MNPSHSHGKRIIHLLPNAHLDPVWLWDWREGLNEGLITVRTVLDLMDEYPELTFIRGESSIYRHIEKTEPATFKRIERQISAGRWDIVGGTYNQPDTNLAATETLCRQYEVGLAYFEKRFGFRPTIAWQADSFGHTPGLPNIMNAFGMKGFTFTRPQRKEFPLPETAFWWESAEGASILCYRQHFGAYCSERRNLPAILDETLRESEKLPLANVGLLMGLGNHGGGPTRRHIADAREWAAAHPEVEVRYSTFHGFFDELRKELATMEGKAVPRVRGDLGYCLRGCYSSVAKFKFAYRRAETLVSQAETTQALVSHALRVPAESLAPAWEGILFNSFHDILPGTSIERAFDDQLSWVGWSAHQASLVQFAALNQLAGHVDTTVPPASEPDRAADVPMLLWNPLPRPFRGFAEFEAALDYRPVWTAPAAVGSVPLSLLSPDGKPVIFQEIPTEHTCMRNGAWRKRVLAQVEIPALGWAVYQLGCRDQPAPKTRPKRSDCAVIAGKLPGIRNKDWEIRLTGKGQISVRHKGESVFTKGGVLGLRVVDDVWGSWGGMNEERGAYEQDDTLESWRITEHAILETGPERAKLWTRWRGERSWADITFSVTRDAQEIQVEGRLLWNERSARLKLILPSSGPLRMQVPASSVERNVPGNLPCGRWFRRGKGAKALGFVSDVLGDVDATPDETRVTIVRASRYADDVPTPAGKDPWMPAADCGELKFRFWLARGGTNLELLSQALIQPPVAVHVPSRRGELPRSGSLGRLEPDDLVLLAAKPDEKGNLSLRVQNVSGSEAKGRFTSGNATHAFGGIAPGEISHGLLSAAKPALKMRMRRARSLPADKLGLYLRGNGKGPGRGIRGKR